MITPYIAQKSAWLALMAAVFFTASASADEPDQNLGPTLLPATSPVKRPTAEGFLQRWLILEPIHANGLTDSSVQAAVKADYVSSQLSVVSRAGDPVTVGGTNLTWYAVDTKNYNVNLFHYARALNRPTSNVMFWVVTVVHCPEELTGVRLAIGSNAASVWWVNGQEVIGLYGDRQTVIDDGVSKRLTLRKGPNVVRGAVVNAGGATDFCARFLDTEDRPLLLPSSVLLDVDTSSAQVREPVVTESGMVQGTFEKDLTVYRGIPFAAPPIGDLRWRPPQPAAHWEGVRAVTEFAPDPYQGNGTGNVSEDCLYLNIWTPAKSADAALPVLVWIYGGGFSFGSTSTSTHNGEHLAREGVVLVSINYRVGPLGFLAHPELSAEWPRHVSGNYGLQDQIVLDAYFAWRRTPEGRAWGD